MKVALGPRPLELLAERVGITGKPRRRSPDSSGARSRLQLATTAANNAHRATDPQRRDHH